MSITCEICRKTLDVSNLGLGAFLPDDWIHVGNDLYLKEDDGCYFCSEQCLIQYLLTRVWWSRPLENISVEASLREVFPALNNCRTESVLQETEG